MTFADYMRYSSDNALDRVHHIVRDHPNMMAFRYVVRIVLSRYPLVGERVDECCHNEILLSGQECG